MNKATTISRLIKRKVATAALIAASLAAFAALGDGGKNNQQQSNSLFNTFTKGYKSFSLKSTYNYRGSNLLNKNSCEQKYIMLNTVFTVQKGNNTYILPLKKKVLLEKVRFNPGYYPY